MSWRPQGWKEIKKAMIPHLARFDGGTDPYISGYDTGIEFGADAMLKTLRVKGIQVEPTDYISNHLTGVSQAARVGGKFVFIPDDGNSP